jgi:hypothetical protein
MKVAIQGSGDVAKTLGGFCNSAMTRPWARVIEAFCMVGAFPASCATTGFTRSSRLFERDRGILFKNYVAPTALPRFF